MWMEIPFSLKSCMVDKSRCSKVTILAPSSHIILVLEYYFRMSYVCRQKENTALQSMWAAVEAFDERGKDYYSIG